MVTFVSSPQLGLCPFVNETQVAPIVIATGLSSDNVVVHDFGGILQRQPGDGTPVFLTLEKICPQFACLGNGASKQILRSPFLPIVRQPRVQRAVHALDLLKAESVQTGMW